MRRKAAEALVMNGTVTVSIILAIEGDCVKVGIEAPPGVSVMRSERLSLPEQQARLRRKQAELKRETEPEARTRLKASIAQMQQAMRQMQPIELRPA